MNCKTCKHSNASGLNQINAMDTTNKQCIECLTKGNLRGWEPRETELDRIKVWSIFLLAVVRMFKTASIFSMVCGLWLYGMKYFIPLTSIAIILSIAYEWLATDLKIKISKLK